MAALPQSGIRSGWAPIFMNALFQVVTNTIVRKRYQAIEKGHPLSSHGNKRDRQGITIKIRTEMAAD
jgi:hypothetical protein